MSYDQTTICINQVQEILKSPEVATVGGLVSPIAIMKPEEVIRAMTSKRKMLGFPIFCLIYQGLNPVTGEAKRELRANLTLDIGLIGLEGLKPIPGFNESSVEPITILAALRAAMRLTNNEWGSPWVFVHEVPYDFGIAEVEFVQRWQTTVTI